MITKEELGHNGLFATPRSMMIAKKTISCLAREYPQCEQNIFLAASIAQNSTIQHIMTNYDLRRKSDDKQ